MTKLIDDPDIRKSLELQCRNMSRDLNDGHATVGTLTVRFQDIIKTLLDAEIAPKRAIRTKKVNLKELK